MQVDERKKFGNPCGLNSVSAISALDTGAQCARRAVCSPRETGSVPQGPRVGSAAGHRRSRGLPRVRRKCQNAYGGQEGPPLGPASNECAGLPHLRGVGQRHGHCSQHREQQLQPKRCRAHQVRFGRTQHYRQHFRQQQYGGLHQRGTATITNNTIATTASNGVPFTKTILNQCNTIFALQSFDQTGLEFLKNYIGEGHAHALSTLLKRQVVIFGKASSSRRPVIARLKEIALPPQTGPEHTEAANEASSPDGVDPAAASDPSSHS